LDVGENLYVPLDVKVDAAGNNLYVIDFSSLLYRSDLNGNGAVNLGPVGGLFPCCLALDLVGGKIYISASHTVTRADLPDGTNPVALNIPLLGNPSGIAIYRPGH
jgi:DNA-binding beta-propeller fold protein YncE